MEDSISSIRNSNTVFKVWLDIFYKNVKEKQKKIFEFTSISSCVTPMSAARRDILSESGCLQDLKASSRAMDFSLSSPSLLRISAIVGFFALVVKNVELGNLKFVTQSLDSSCLFWIPRSGALKRPSFGIVVMF